jgi:acetyl-CoA carboxylase biotin carboxyl carrier protein
MNLDEIKDLLDAVVDRDINEFEWESGKEKVRIRRGAEQNSGGAQPPYIVVASGAPGGALPAAPVPAGGASPPSAPGSAALAAADNHTMITAPIVGTFYESPSPEAPAFVQVGDRVDKGQVLCIIEAMKLMNEIESEASGVVIKRFVANAQPVEYGEALFAIEAD